MKPTHMGAERGKQVGREERGGVEKRDMVRACDGYMRGVPCDPC